MSNLLAALVPGTYNLAKSDGGNLVVETLPAGAGPVDAVTASLPLTSSGGVAPNIAINPATDATPGSLSAADKTKLDGITAGAAVASVGVTAPIVNTGTATAPVLGLAPITAPVGANLVSLSNQSAATMNAGINAASWTYTPTSSGLVVVSFNLNANMSAYAALVGVLQLFTGGAVGGGTPTNGVNFLVGSTPTRTGGTFVQDPLFNLGGSTSVAIPSVFQGGLSGYCLLQLTPGTAYTFNLNMSQQTGGLGNWTNITLGLNCFEVR
jgi:hypothetical protein